MFVEVVIFIILGVFIGFLAGLAPGIHPNTIFAMVLSLSFLFAWLPIQVLLAFAVSLAVSNTFFDFIPSIIFGAPEEDSVLSTLPGHRMLLKGRGYEAIFLTVVGGLGVMLLTIISLPAMLFTLPMINEAIRPIMHIILASVVIWMMLGEKKRIAAVFIFFASGIFGFITLNSFSSDVMMFPALTGLFGISTLLTSIMARTKIPKQKTGVEVRAEWLKGTLTGWFAGLLAGLLPGLGSSQTGIIASRFTGAKIKEFMITLGGINTSNIFFTFVVFYVVGKTRSGAAWFISQIVDQLTFQDLALLVAVGIITSLVSAVLTLRTAGFLLRKMKDVNYTKITAATLMALVFLVSVLSGPIGLLVSAAGMFLGLLTISLGVKRIHMMGFLVFPTIMYFSGLNSLLFTILW
jgi:putative membrane protein